MTKIQGVAHKINPNVIESCKCVTCLIDTLIDLTENDYENNKIQIMTYLFNYCEQKLGEGEIPVNSDHSKDENLNKEQSKLKELIDFIPLCSDSNELLNKLEKIRLSSNHKRNQSLNPTIIHR